MIDKIDDKIIYNIYRIVGIVAVLIIAFYVGMFIAQATAGTPTPTDTEPKIHELLERTK